MTAKNGQGKIICYSSSSFSSLKTDEYYDILLKMEPDKYSELPAKNPVPGEIYVYVAENFVKVEDWKADGYSWRHMGPKKLPSLNPKVWCHYAVFGNFKRRAYTLFYPQYKYNPKTVVHYTGIINLEKRPHGNALKSTSNFIPTAKSVLAEIAAHANDTPRNTYQKLMNNDNIPPGYQSVLLPRNLKQVTNKIFTEHQKIAKNCDDLYSLYVICDKIKGFVKEYAFLPEILCILYSTESMAIFEEIADYNSCILFYETISNIGVYSLLVLSYVHPIFNDKPTIPLAYGIYLWDSDEVHNSFFKHMKSKCEKFVNKIIVTNRKITIYNAIKEKFPGNINVFCWDHIIRLTERWLKDQNDKTNEDIKTIKGQIWNLLDSTSFNEFHDRWEIMAAQWNAKFLNYAKHHLYEAIKESGRWVAEPLKIYTPKSGISMKQPESLHAVLKRCKATGKKQLGAHILAVTLYNVDLFYQREITFSRASMGSYTLSNEFEHLHLALDDCVCPSKIIDIDDLPKVILNQDFQLKPIDNNNDEILNSLGKMIFLMGGVKFVPESKGFIVSNQRNEKYWVTLYPNETCTCILKKNCSHISAAKTSIGDERPVRQHKRMNLSEMILKRRALKLNLEKRNESSKKSTKVKGAKEVLHTCYGRSLYAYHLKSLEYEKESDCGDDRELYLDDIIVDVVLAILSQERRQISGSRVQCCAVEVLLLSQCPFQMILANFLRDNIPEKDVVLFPACINSHYFLLVVIPRKKLVIYLDSMQSYLKVSSVVQDKLELLFAAYLTYYQMKKINFDASEWRIVSLENTPQQSNTYDCGVFIILFAQTIIDENKSLEKFVKNTFSYRKYIKDLIDEKMSENVSKALSAIEILDKSMLPEAQPDILIPEMTYLNKGQSIFPYLANIINSTQKLLIDEFSN